MGLLPCPFCGGEAGVTERPRGYRVECKNRFFGCPVNLRTHHNQDIDLAVEAWNSRPLEDAKYKAGMLAAAEIAEKPIGNGLCSRDDVWQPKIAKAIRKATKEE